MNHLCFNSSPAVGLSSGFVFYMKLQTEMSLQGQPVPDSSAVVLGPRPNRARGIGPAWPAKTRVGPGPLPKRVIAQQGEIGEIILIDCIRK